MKCKAKSKGRDGFGLLRFSHKRFYLTESPHHPPLGLRAGCLHAPRLHQKGNEQYAGGQKVLSEPSRFETPKGGNAQYKALSDAVVDAMMPSVDPTLYRKTEKTRWAAAMNLLVNRHFSIVDLEEGL